MPENPDRHTRIVDAPSTKREETKAHPPEKQPCFPEPRNRKGVADTLNLDGFAAGDRGGTFKQIQRNRYVCMPWWHGFLLFRKFPT